jgi:hypothetical protein
VNVISFIPNFPWITSQLFILRRLSGVSIRAALNLKRGGKRDYYMCSLSSRCFLLLNLFFTTTFVNAERLGVPVDSSFTSMAY